MSHEILPPMEFDQNSSGHPCLEGIGENQLTKKNIETVAKLEAFAKNGRTVSDKIADAVSQFCGSTAFLYVHFLWFGVWMIVNGMHVVPEQFRFDPYPFEFLTFVVSLEAIFLSTFVLISQNRQNKVSERRNYLDLQINMLAEQENSKMLCMLQAISEKLGITSDDPEIAALEETIDTDKLAKQIDEIMDKHEAHPKKSGSASH